AWRCELLRDSWRPESLCRMGLSRLCRVGQALTGPRPAGPGAGLVAAPSDEAAALLFVLEAGRWPAFQAHAEHQAVALQHFLDLGERLLAEVWRAQQLHFRPLHQIADVMDVFGLEAVGAAHRELELIDRTQQDRIELHLGRLGGRLFFALQIDEDGELILQDASGATDGLFRLDRAIGLDVDDQLVQVRALLHTCRLDRVGHTTHRAEGGVQQQPADRAALFLEAHALHRRTIAAATLHLQLHAQLAGLGQVGNHEVGIDDLDVVIHANVSRGDRTGALLVQPQVRAGARVHAQCHGLEVQQDVDDVLLHPLDAGVLVQYPIDLDLGDRRTGHGGQQHSPQGIAQRMTEAALEGLDDHTRLTGRDRLHLDDARLQKFRYRCLHARHSRPVKRQS